MNLGITINAVRIRWAAAFAEVPLHLKLAPESAKAPYAVMLFGAVSRAGPTTEEKDYESQITFAIFTETDSEIISLLDGTSDAFGSKPFSGITMIESPDATFDMNYTDRGALWSGEITFTIQWSKPR